MNIQTFNEFLLENNVRSAITKELITRGFFEFGDGWLGITAFYMKKAIKDGWKPEIFQAKEKYGELRIYDLPEPYYSRLRTKSHSTCELCGSANAFLTTINRWYQTLCHECERKSLERKI